MSAQSIKGHPKGLCWYSHKDKLCFVGVPKNAQTSIRKMFDFNEPPQASGIYYDLIEVTDWAKEFTLFCVMRNPYHRVVSAYLEIIKRASKQSRDLKNPANALHKKAREMPFFSMKESEDRFAEFLNQVEGEFWDAHIEPQVFYLLDHSGQLLPFDHVLSFENIDADINEFCRAIGMDKKLPHLNFKSTVDKKRIMGYINNNPTIKNKIYKIYKQDFELYKELIGEDIE